MFSNLSDTRVTSGLNISEFDKTVLEIDEIANQLQKLFSEAEIVMLNARDSYYSETANRFFESFDTFKTNFDVVVANVKTCESDLIKVKSNFLSLDLGAANNFKQIGKDGKRYV